MRTECPALRVRTVRAVRGGQGCIPCQEDGFRCSGWHLTLVLAAHAPIAAPLMGI